MFLKIALDVFLSRYWTKEVRDQVLLIEQQRADVVAAGGDPNTISTYVSQVSDMRAYCDVTGSWTLVC